MADPSPPGGASDLRHTYFATLREEILQVKARLNRLVVTGLIGLPVLTWFAYAGNEEGRLNLVLLMSPMLALILLVQYFAEQASMMRAGRYLYEKVETSGDDWEHWINEMRSRTTEPPVFGLFVIVIFGYVILMGSLAVTNLLAIEPRELSVLMYRVCLIAVPVIYGVSLLWVLIVLARFWHNAFRAV